MSPHSIDQHLFEQCTVLKDCDPVVFVAMGLWCRHSQEECEAAVKGLHNQELDGGRIKVTLILANAASSGGGY